MVTKSRSELFSILKENMKEKNLLIPGQEETLSEKTLLEEVFDSFSKVEAINDMESMFHFTAKDEEWGKAQSLGDFIDVIERHA